MLNKPRQTSTRTNKIRLGVYHCANRIVLQYRYFQFKKGIPMIDAVIQFILYPIVNYIFEC